MRAAAVILILLSPALPARAQHTGTSAQPLPNVEKTSNDETPTHSNGNRLPVRLGFSDAENDAELLRPRPGSIHALATPRRASVPQSHSFADSAQSKMVGEFVRRSVQLQDDEIGPAAFPVQYQPWWVPEMESGFRADAVPLPVTLEQMILSALSHSPTVKALRIEPSIRRKAIAVEDAEFDWLSYAEATWDDLSDPVGSTLTTGVSGPSRFRDHRANLDAGLRRKTRSGGQLEISTQGGWQKNNSLNFIPTTQGTRRLEVSYTHPLLRSSGTVYNRSRIVLARLDTRIAVSEQITALQTHLVEVSQSYWELFRARAVLLQKRKLLSRAESILQRLEGRRGVDVLQRQLLRAKAAVAARRSEIARAAAAVRNAESQLRLLVNDPALTTGPRPELVPVDAPLCQDTVYSTRETVRIALLSRPDIAQAIRQIRGQAVRLGMMKKDVLPQLDLIMNTYVAGLAGDGNVWKAGVNRFTEGEPGYSLGLRFEYPLGNRAARARAEQQQLRVRKAVHEFRAVVETGITEVELAVRETRTAYQEMFSRYQAMLSAESEAIFLQERWNKLPGDDRTTAELLEDLLDAQERVANEENSFEAARSAYMMALVEVKRVTGTLLAESDGSGSLLRRSPTSLTIPPAILEGSAAGPPALPPATPDNIPPAAR